MRGSTRTMVAAVLAVCAGAAAVTGCVRHGPGVVRGDRDVAVVLLSGPNRLVTVDLDSRRVAASVPLRSLALDVAVDRASGRAVTAQCGGIGAAADNAAGVCDVRAGGPVTYIRLPRANPCFVACADGRAFLQHGVYDEGALYMSVLDLGRREVVRSGPSPDGPGVCMVPGPDGVALLAARGGAAGGDEAAGAAVSVESFDPSDLSTRSVSPLPAGATLLCGDDRGSLLALGAHASGRRGPAWSAEVQPGEATPTAVPIRGLRSVSRGCVTSRYVIAASGQEGEPSDAGKVVVAERASGRAAGVVTLDGDVLALCAWRERVLAVTGAPLRLVAIDPARPRILFEVDLEGERVIGADVDVLLADR